jgi:hypothetical protein
VNWIDPLGLYSFSNFYRRLQPILLLQPLVLALTPGAEPAASFLLALRPVRRRWKLLFTSDSPFIDTVKESIKMTLPVKEPFNMFTDKAVDLATEKAKEKADKNNKRCK